MTGSTDQDLAALARRERRRCHGNRSEAARRLGISRPALLVALRKHGLET
jgi:transcriptional regulator of acetoin/glycerol metabolism